MASVRSTFSMEEELAERARELGVNVSAAARKGVAEAVRAALAQADREAYRKQPEVADDFWRDAEAWTDQ